MLTDKQIRDAKPKNTVYRLRDTHSVVRGFGVTIARCCQTNERAHQYLVDGNFYEITKERHSVRVASRFSLKILRFESDLCELNRL